MASKFKITGDIEARYGRDPNHSLEAHFNHPEDDNLVMVGVGMRAANHNVTTLQLLYARIDADGAINLDNTITIKRGTDPGHSLEVWFQCPSANEVIVGLGLRAADNNVTTMHVHTRRLKENNGRLASPHTHRVGRDPNHSLEVEGFPEGEREQTLLRGFGVRMADDNITTMANFYGKVEER